MDEALRPALIKSGEAAPFARVQSSAPQRTKTKPASAVTNTARKLLPPTIPEGAASAAQRSKAIWAAKRMARSIRRRRPASDHPAGAKRGGACGGSSQRPSSFVTKSVLDQDTEDDHDDSSTGSTASFVDEDANASDEENRVRIVS